MMIAALHLQSVAQLFAERILNCTAEGVVIALLAWLVLRAIGPQNSNTRFAVWFAALLGIATLPLFGNWASSGAEFTQPSEITMPGSWALYIFAAWLLMAAAGLLRVGLGFWHLHQLRKSCVPVDVARLDPVLKKTLEEFDSPRSVTLCVSDRLRVPTAIGFMKPLVVIPSWTMRELSIAELNTILLHELAHLRRRDDWTNLVQKILGALLFFHPAVWWIEKKLALEREMACDDLVLARTTSPRAYAECLVSLAEKSLLRRGLALAQAAVDRLRNVSLRVAQILDVDRPMATRVWRPAPILVGGVSLVCLVALSQAPTRLVSFENGAPPSSQTNAAAPRDFQASQISHMGAHVIPAKLQLGPEDVRVEKARSQEKGPAPMVATSGVKNSFPRTNKPDVIPANAVQRRVKPPTLIRSSMAKDGLAPQTLFLVMRTEFVQTRQYDGSGAVVWDLCVWQVTVIGPGRELTAGQIIAKAI
ncbi:MAG: M56 family metallopeptidase [Acidobacteriia bacterium]|nr:M56 family metallopeptidase [Terriglobia bacterium]